MRCPKCQRTYADTTLTFCLHDGERLISSRADQSAPTLVMTEEDRQDVDRLALAHQVTMQSVTRFLGKDLMTFDDIMQLAPRCMTEADVKRALDSLVKRGSLKTTAVAGHDVYFFGD